MVDEACGIEPGPSGKSTPHSRSHNQNGEKTHHRTHHHHHHKKPTDHPSKESTFEMIHKLEKRFRNFLQLTTEKLDEQKEIDNKHYSDLKNDITSMEKNLERTARNSAIEMIENVTKELDGTMKKWAKALKGMKFEEKKNISSSAASSTFDIVCEEEGKVVTKAMVQRPHLDAEALTSSTPIKSSKTPNKVNGHVVREDPEEITELGDGEPVKAMINDRTEVCSGCEHEESFEGRLLVCNTTLMAHV